MSIIDRMLFARCVMVGLVLVLRHQLNVLRRKTPKRVAFSSLQRSPIPLTISRFAGDSRPCWVYGRDRPAVSNLGNIRAQPST